jgi:hypothetical protein
VCVCVCVCVCVRACACACVRVCVCERLVQVRLCSNPRGQLVGLPSAPEPLRRVQLPACRSPSALDVPFPSAAPLLRCRRSDLSFHNESAHKRRLITTPDHARAIVSLGRYTRCDLFDLSALPGLPCRRRISAHAARARAASSCPTAPSAAPGPPLGPRRASPAGNLARRAARGGARMSAGAAGAAPRPAAAAAAAQPPAPPPPPPYILAGAPPARRVRLIDPSGAEEHADENPWLHMRLRDGGDEQQARPLLGGPGLMPLVRALPPARARRGDAAAAPALAAGARRGWRGPRPAARRARGGRVEAGCPAERPARRSQAALRARSAARLSAARTGPPRPAGPRRAPAGG